jgi:hypothetical protein
MKVARMAAFVLAASLAAPSMAALAPYTENFEGLNAGSPSALSDAGWLVFANVFSPDHSTYFYGYGPFPAPNGGAGFSALATGEQGLTQGLQYLNAYSDYNNNGAHGAGQQVEANVFQERVIAAADLGKTFDFKFDYKASGSSGPGGTTTTLAFIKVLDPDLGYSLVAFPTLDTTAASTSVWSNGNTLSVAIDNSWAGNILQFGFASTATNYQPSGVFYDNLSFSEVPEPASMSILALAGLLSLRRARR